MSDAWIAVLGTIGGTLVGAFITNRYVDKREKVRLKNDLLAKIRLMMAEPFIETFERAIFSIEATDELVNNLERFKHEFKLLLYSYHNYNKNSDSFLDMLNKLNSFVYRVRCHRGGETHFYEEDGILQWKPMVLNKHICVLPIFDRDGPETMVAFKEFYSAVNDLPNTLK